MGRLHNFILISMMLCSLVYGATVYEFFEDVENNSTAYTIVVGNNASPQEVIFASDIASVTGITESVLAREADTNKSLLILGTPGSNELIAQLAENWSYSDEQTVMKTVEKSLIIGSSSVDMLDIAVPYVEDYTNFDAAMGDNVFIIHPEPPREEDKTPDPSDLGSGGGGYQWSWEPPPEEAPCIVDWRCGSWSECYDGIQVRNCTNYGNCYGTQPPVQKTCIIVQEPEEEPEFMAPPVFEEKIPKPEQVGNNVNIPIVIENMNEEELQHMHVEINFNQGRSTKYVDFIDMIEIEERGTRYINRVINAKSLKPGSFDIVIKLYHMGKVAEENSYDINIKG